jgi:probable phosphoglycerate mutase
MAWRGLRQVVAMAPDDADFFVIFDGGSLNNPGHGYGSFQLRALGQPPVLHRLDYGDGVTSNEAEYRTLLAAVEQALVEAQAAGRDPRVLRFLAYGDSQLVVNQVAGRWGVKAANLRPLRDRARELLSAFGTAEVRWHPRARSVAALGH